MLFDAGTLAAGWLAVYQATGKDNDRPALNRTIHVDQYPHGCRIVATDTYILLGCWVPEKFYDTDPEPSLDEIPYASATAIDTHGRGAGLLAHLLKLAGSDDYKGVEATLHLNVPWQPAEHGDELQIEGLEALAVTIEQADREHVQLEVYEGSYVRWQTAVGRHRGNTSRGQVALPAWVAARLAKAAKVHGDLTPIRCWVGGRDKPVAVAFGGQPEVVGLVMPTAWNFDNDAPFDTAEPDE